MIETLGSFVAELRAVGLPVSTAEAIDAAHALELIDISAEAAVREALAATMIKAPRHRQAFDIAFDVFFSGAEAPELAPPEDSAAPLDPATTEALMERIAEALRSGDSAGLRENVRTAVSDLAGFQSGRPVGGRYYLYRVLQRLGGLEQLLHADSVDGPLAARLDRDDVADLMELLRSELRREIVRRLVADRGADAVARTLREPLVEDLDLMYANAAELSRIEAAVVPLARKLASRLAAQNRRSRRGRPDLRRTIRASLSHGGALVAPKHRKPRRSKPEIVLLCDVSGSMATFARFTLQLTYAVGSQFSRVRSFAFVDAVDEVTRFLVPSEGFAAGVARMHREANVVAHDGHSDYGSVWRAFEQDLSRVITPATTLIVTGDARNNYRDAEAHGFGELAKTARSVLWLNPEAKRFWDTGDSIMSRYAPFCDGVHEVRTLRQLERFVEQVATRPRVRRRQVLN